MDERVCEEGFLKEYLRYTQSTEVPEYFALWCGVSIINACLERECFINLRPRVYPNLYIVLIAESALCRKSTAILQAMDILNRIDDPPRVLAQKTSCEKFIAQLKTPTVPVVHDTETGVSTGVVSGAQGILIADELATLLDKNAFISGLIDILTAIFTCPDRFVYETRAHDREIIVDACVSLLGGTTLSWIRTSIPEAAIGQGFTSRVIFVNSKPSGRLISLPEYTDEVRQAEERLVHDLNCIRAMNGEFKMQLAAKKTYDDLYKSFARGSPFVQDMTLAGYAGRRGALLHKVAMAFSASQDNRLTLSSDHYMQANQLLEVAETQMPKVMRTVTATEVGDMNANVLQFIASYKGRVPRTQLLRRFSYRVNAAGMDDVVKTLIESGQIQAMYEGSKVLYFIP